MTSGTKFEDYLAIETAGGATWHPSGKRIAFTSNATGLYQIYTCEVEKSTTRPRRQLTDEVDRCTDPQYLSDGTLIFTRDRGGDENFQIGLIEEDGTLNWMTSDFEAKHRIGHVSDSYLYYVANLTDRARLDVYRWKIPLLENEPELILEPEEGMMSIAAASPDDSKILIEQFFGNMDQHLLLLDINSGKVMDQTAAISGKQPVRWSVVKWLDPEHILVNTDFQSDFKRLAIISLSGEFRPLDSLSETVRFEIENKYTSTEDSVWTFFVENEDGYSTIHRAKFSKDGVADLETLQLPLRGVIPAGDARSWSTTKALTLSKNEQLLAITISSGVKPTNVWIVDTDDKTNWKANDINTAGLDTSTFVEPTLHRFKSFDGLRVPYFRYVPKGERPAGGWPALLVIHGGPESQIRPDFSPIIQFYLSSGFAVITPNIRG
ncbi:MAG: S9 family peptidase, partial [Candidatus Thorarchaeota archaeon]